MIDEKQLIKEIKEAANTDRYEGYVPAAVLFEVIDMIREQPAVGEWIPCSERLPEKVKRKDTLFPTHNIMTKYGVTEGWYNPDQKSWYVLTWFGYSIYDEQNIDFEMGDIPKVIRVPLSSEIVTAWQPLPEPWKGENTWI